MFYLNDSFGIYFNLDCYYFYYVLYLFICDIILSILCTDRLTDGTSPLPERLRPGRVEAHRGRTHLRLHRSLPFGTLLQLFRPLHRDLRALPHWLQALQQASRPRRGPRIDAAIKKKLFLDLIQ